jgi:hypothetical protein
MPVNRFESVASLQDAARDECEHDDHPQGHQAGRRRLGRQPRLARDPLHGKEETEPEHDAGAEHGRGALQEAVRLAEQLEQQVDAAHEQQRIEQDENQPCGARHVGQLQLQHRHGDIRHGGQPQQQAGCWKVLWTSPPEYDVEICLQEMQHVSKRRA